MGLLIAALLLPAPPDAARRLNDAVAEADFAGARDALEEIVKGDGAEAARTLVGALPDARRTMDRLLRRTVSARATYDRVRSTFSFGLQKEEEIKNESLERARKRIEEAGAEAVAGEQIYDALRRGFGRLGAGAAPELAREFRRTRSWLLRCELADALGALKADGILVTLLDPGLEPVVLAAVLHNVQTPAARRYLDHEQWQVRLAALKSLRGDRASAGRIAESIEGADVRYQVEACRTLARMTGTRLPPDPAVWRDWWRLNGEAVLDGRYRPQFRKDPEGPGRTTFYGVPVTSSRVCFIIDRSRSMRKSDRFEKATRELTSLLDRLPDGSHFNLYFFGETVKSFARHTRELDARARRDAARFIRSQDPDRGTDLYRALEKATTLVGNADTGRLRPDGVDTFIVLSDGEATQGRLVDGDLVARVAARRVRYLRPVVHTISLSSDAASLRLLADLTGGEYRKE